MMANGHLGPLILGKNGIFPQNSPPNPCIPHGFLIPRRPILGITMDCMLVRKSWVFDGRAPKFRVVSALASGEAEAPSADLRSLEKELKFSPTFSDYVKIMESVKSDRSRDSDGDLVDSSLKKRLTGKSDTFVADVKGKKRSVKSEKRLVRVRDSSRDGRKNGEDDRRNRVKPGAVERSCSTSGSRLELVQELFDKGAAGRSGGSVRDEMLEIGNKSDVKEGRKVDLYKKASGARVKMVSKQFEEQEIDRLNGRMDSKGNELVDDFGVSNRIKSRVGSRKTDIDGKSNGSNSIRENEPNRNTLAPKAKISSPVKRTFEKDRDFSHDYSHVGKDGAFRVHSEDGARSSKVCLRDMDNGDFEDRAAFKTFKVFTDVRNRPRVLRMEMEERIQKLASRLNATDVNMPEWQFSKMMHGTKIRFSDHSILRVVQILGRLGNWKRVLQVVEWLQTRERFKSYKSRYIYTTVLDVLGKAKRPFEALNIFYTMRKELSSYPDLAAYHCIAVTLGQAGLMKELFDVIDCMRALPEKKFKLGPLQKWDPRLEPDLIVYNAVLNACVQQKQWEGAFWVLQQLRQQNIRPTNTTYGLVMEVMLACGKYNLVYEFFRKVEKSSIPSTLNYKMLINALWREGKIDEAVLAAKDMERRGIVGSASLYYDLARCLCSAGRCQEALLQVDKICKVAKKPLVVTYTGLIQTCVDSGNMENAGYIFNQMQRFCSPNIVTCNIMLKSYIEHGMFEEAKGLFHKILDGSHQINSKTDLNKRVVPDKFTFNTMMEACAETKNWEEFENVFQQMLHHGYHFDSRRHLRMVLDAFRAGKTQVLDATWDHLLSFRRVPPPPLIMERFCLKLIEGDPAASISSITSCQDTELHNISAKAWLNLLLKNADRLKKDTIVELACKVSNLIASSSRPQPVFQNILDSCTKFLPDIPLTT
ncbi:pentatricopeptide repeat-containing protein At1g30610, chloroplastic isoform X2 [Ananas comosus]|uniref:Pentatricopeptide repeat-containing protein At1g30610, chloroplastic isoform X2 n=1 Tax=Ananas comosus TaxID=4615 RepID=A0A6P5G5Q5_ANACO|nr:pentatricopeptide repeat-containing protein At1g30610, chloroplastic isoform X2 [Ananas comosus]